MHDNGRDCMVQGYNAQLAVDGERQVIVAADVTQDALDRGQLLAMMQGVECNTGQRPGTFTADAGYWDMETVRQALHSGVQVLVPPDGAAVMEAGQPRQMASNPLAQQMRGEISTEAGRALYRMRQTVVEPVFGSTKELRCFRRFKLRGLARVQAEWQIICATHNLLKLFRYHWLPGIA